MILLDTSGVLAAVDPRQAHHTAAARVLMRQQRRILSHFVLAELDYLIANHGGVEQEVKLLQDVAIGAYELAPFAAEDVGAARDIINRYADLAIGLADASIAVLSRRLGCRDVLSLDQRHFRVLTAANELPFRLLPFDDEE